MTAAHREKDLHNEEVSTDSPALQPRFPLMTRIHVFSPSPRRFLFLCPPVPLYSSAACTTTCLSSVSSSPWLT